MSTAGNAFNWRGFWADLLRGAGHGLLALDGSKAAEAAMMGLDFFEAAQRRRRDEEQARDKHDELAMLRERRMYSGLDRNAAEESAIVDRRSVHVPQDYEEGDQAQDYSGVPRVYDRIARPASGLSPSVRPIPFSADPYEYGGRPIERMRGSFPRYVRR